MSKREKPQPKHEAPTAYVIHKPAAEVTDAPRAAFDAFRAVDIIHGGIYPAFAVRIEV